MDGQLSIAHHTLHSENTTYIAPARAFTLGIDWDLDSTPVAVKRMSRALGIRRPRLEAAIILASLGHDIRYYYGGSSEMKKVADQIFADQVNHFSSILKGPFWTGAVAGIDKFGVSQFGGKPFKEPYSWGYGLDVKDRGYTQPSTVQQGAIEDAVWVLTCNLLNGKDPLQHHHKQYTTPRALSQLTTLIHSVHFIRGSAGPTRAR